MFVSVWISQVYIRNKHQTPLSLQPPPRATRYRCSLVDRLDRGNVGGDASLEALVDKLDRCLQRGHPDVPGQ